MPSRWCSSAPRSGRCRTVRVPAGVERWRSRAGAGGMAWSSRAFGSRGWYPVPRVDRNGATWCSAYSSERGMVVREAHRSRCRPALERGVSRCGAGAPGRPCRRSTGSDVGSIGSAIRSISFDERGSASIMPGRATSTTLDLEACPRCVFELDAGAREDPVVLGEPARHAGPATAYIARSSSSPPSRRSDSSDITAERNAYGRQQESPARDGPARADLALAAAGGPLTDGVHPSARPYPPDRWPAVHVTLARHDRGECRDGRRAAAACDRPATAGADAMEATLHANFRAMAGDEPQLTLSGRLRLTAPRGAQYLLGRTSRPA